MISSSVCHENSPQYLLNVLVGQFDVKHIITLSIKATTSVLKVLTYIITSITTHPIRLAVILAIMSVSTFNSDVILYTIDYQQQMFRMIFQTCQYIIYLFLPLNVIQCIIILYIWTPMFKTHMKILVLSSKDTKHFGQFKNSK
jgi:hypothetical protein